ncbi:MAG: S-layer homology domain-containing protein, partial [Firmicutes bacterium]|nr:S-layer homology domain-containing protein [Bacillota bacterium]
MRTGVGLGHVRRITRHTYKFSGSYGKKLGLEQEYGPVDFTDIPPDFITTRYIYPALKAGLVTGYPDNTFRPYELITKNEAEIIMSKALNRPVPPWYKNSTCLTWK